MDGKVGKRWKNEGKDGQAGAWGGQSDEAKSVVARDEVNYIMHMTGGRQYKKQSTNDGGMPPLN